MPTLPELLAQKEALDREIERTKTKARDEALDKVRALMTEYGLTPADLSPRAPSRQKGATGKKVPAKYRNASTGESWSGRGLQPKWLKAAIASGRKLGDFAL